MRRVLVLIQVGTNQWVRSLVGALKRKIANYFDCSTDFLIGLENETYQTNFKQCPPFYQRFNFILKHFKISRYKLGQLTNISESALYFYAKGQREPSLQNLILICEKLNCTLDFLLGRYS